MHDEDDVPDPGLRRHLLDDLQSISTSLDSAPPTAPADVDIPLLVDVVDLPARKPPPVVDPQPAAAQAVDAPEDTDDIIAIEAARIVDELIDEFLPQLEARLRERLDALRAGLARPHTNNAAADTAHGTGN